MLTRIEGALMWFTLLLSAFWLLLLAPAARAAGVALYWDQCSHDGGRQNMRFACDTNGGSHELAGSVGLDADLAQVNGAEIVLFLDVWEATLPQWWRFVNAGACRQSALSMTAPGSLNCPDLFEGLATAQVVVYQPGVPEANLALASSIVFTPDGVSVDLLAGQEYALARWTISNENTVGAGACAGCLSMACWKLQSVVLTTVGHANDVILTEWLNPGANFVTWQGGAGTTCEPVPTRNSTWGAVKSLYR